MTTSPPVPLGVIAPLSPPGWVEAGLHLLAGIRLATDRINDAGGIGGRPIALHVRDTAGRPEVATAAMLELNDSGVSAVLGEYHSVCACAAAEAADALGLPFLCSSAVIDDLIGHRSDWVARLACPQSRGWAVFGDHLVYLGHRHVAALVSPGRYWDAGADILRTRLEAAGGTLLAIQAEMPMADIRETLVASGTSATVLLTGFPDPAIAITRAVRGDGRLDEMILGAPAGQPEFPEWGRRLGSAGSAVPFLRYRPERLTQLGEEVQASLRRRLSVEPSFVALEGYDSVVVLAEMLRFERCERSGLNGAWACAAAHGTRGVIAFERGDEATFWQCREAGVQIVDRDPISTGRIRTLHTSASGVP